MSVEDEYAISVAKTEYREGYNTSDVERVLSVFADSFTNMSEGEPAYYGEEGKAALRLQATKLFQQCRVRMEVVIIAIVVLGDTAYDYGWHKLALSPNSGGEPQVQRTRYCEIWRKQATGDWKIGFLMTSKDHEPRMLETGAMNEARDKAAV